MCSIRKRTAHSSSAVSTGITGRDGSLLRRPLKAQMPATDTEGHPVDCCEDANHIKNQL